MISTPRGMRKGKQGYSYSFAPQKSDRKENEKPAATKSNTATEGTIKPIISLLVIYHQGQ